MRLGALCAAILLTSAGLAGCLGDRTGPPADDEEDTVPEDQGSRSMAATSQAFDHRGEIPQVHTCDGEGTSPPLTVAGLPEGTVTLALIVGDPDAPVPGAGLMNFTHWVLWNAEPVDGQVAFPEDGTPAGGQEGQNGGGGEGWTGPCPPHPAEPHRYHFTFYAVDTTLDLPDDANRSQLEEALEGHVLQEAGLMGTYERTYGVLPG